MTSSSSVRNRQRCVPLIAMCLVLVCGVAVSARPPSGGGGGGGSSSNGGGQIYFAAASPSAPSYSYDMLLVMKDDGTEVTQQKQKKDRHNMAQVNGDKTDSHRLHDEPAGSRIRPDGSTKSE